VGEVSPRYSAVKGTRDIFPPESERWGSAEAVCRSVFSGYGYGEVRTPVLESTELFARSVGETTDLVHKEMYTFADRKGRSLTLRPENTAGVVRAVIESGAATGPMPLRLWYVGTQYRFERPQAGRYREFRQIGAELLGVGGPAAEAEILTMLFAFLSALGFVGLSVSLNSVGTAATRERLGEALRSALASSASRFGEDDRRKLEQNPLRLFDSKDPEVQSALAAGPRPMDFLDEASRRHHQEVCGLLRQAGIPFTEAPGLVRGLDYYTRTVFEVVSQGLGSQDAILGGGRYDGLVEALGGPALPAIGFAIGEDRLLQAAPYRPPLRGLALVLPGAPEDLPAALRIAEEIRKLGGDLSVETDLNGRGFKKAMGRANDLFSRAGELGFDAGRMFAVLVGERERAQKQVTVKRLSTGEQETFSESQLAERLGAGRQA
jgi:histidyl-tRNA synthetase